MKSTRLPAVVGVGSLLALASCGSEERLLPVIRCEPVPAFFRLATREMAPRVPHSPASVRAVRVQGKLSGVPSHVAGLEAGAWVVAVMVNADAEPHRWARFVVDEATMRRGSGGIIVPLDSETRSLTSWGQGELRDPDVRELAARVTETEAYRSSTTCTIAAGAHDDVQ
jgi:hypothetical protein